MAAIPLSVLDLVPIRAGSSAHDAMRETLALARHAEALGYRRYWFAEHHNMPGIGSSAPAVLIGQVAAATTRMRVGSGGVMLPNHAPLVVAEQFGTLEALFPGRIDLGLGRAPGTDPNTARALRRSSNLAADDFPQQLADLRSFFGGEFPPDHPLRHIRAIPGLGQSPEIWLLGSSGFSAELAGALGLPFSFAHHFSGDNTLPALALYRAGFRASPDLSEPAAMIGVNVVVADSDAEARRLALPSALAFLKLRQGRPGQYPTLAEAEAHPWTEQERAFAEAWMRANVIGGPASVREQLDALIAATGVQELMVLTIAPDTASRLRSYTLLRELYPA